MESYEGVIRRAPVSKPLFCSVYSSSPVIPIVGTSVGSNAYHSMGVSYMDQDSSIDDSQEPEAKLEKSKRLRTSYSNEQIIELENEFKNSQYLQRSRRYQLSLSLELSEHQIKIWFQNRRMKHKKEQLKKFPNMIFDKKQSSSSTGQVFTKIKFPDISAIRSNPCIKYGRITWFPRKNPSVNSDLPRRYDDFLTFKERDQYGGFEPPVCQIPDSDSRKVNNKREIYLTKPNSLQDYQNHYLPFQYRHRDFFPTSFRKHDFLSNSLKILKRL